MEYLRMLYEQFQKLAMWQKVSIGAISALVFFGIIGAAYFYSSGSYTTLYRGLDLETAANIKEKLDEGGYQYKITENGTSIMVQSSQREVALLKLAKDNVLPDRSKGYADIFGTGTSPFSNSRKIEDLNIVRGLQAELETTIKKSIRIVSSVRVHISYAPERVFKDDQKEDKAVVSLVLKGGKKLEDEQIMGIRNLVANGANISDENVRVFDEKFIDLTKHLRSSRTDETMAADQFVLQRKFETEKESKLQEMLDKILGAPNLSGVYVNAELNFDKKEVYDEKIEPPIKGEEGGIVISEELSTEKFSGTGKKPAGVPGTQSNIPTYPEVKDGKDEYAHSETRKNYDTNKQKAKIVYAVGDVKKLNISVVLDDVINKEQFAKVESAIFSASGIDKKRGDTLVVEKIAFNKEIISSQEKQIQRAKFEEMIFQLLLVIIPTLTIFFVLWFVWRNKELIIMHFKPIEVRKEAGQDESVPAEIRERSNKIELIKDFVNRSPKDAASLLQIWLTAE
ncbi:MAG TPA: flagellar basal-body MS-ring/collar protein FliF [Candidatus Wallbacteria bacterium]|nr:flagellar basal-body MS-ring/collar protein FliF [Candidatus Wallbacteria bacterium]